jgi:hypothetical protein
MKKIGTRSLKKYVIFPCCLLIFGAIEEVADYKSVMIPNTYLRVAVMMSFYAFGISLLAYWFTPMVEKSILRMHTVSKIGWGRPGEYLFLLFLLTSVYFLWYQILVHGPESLLPLTWR